MTDVIARRAQLHAIARIDVTEGLGKKHFDAIPYSDNITLRTLPYPSGADIPLSGQIALCAVWWVSLSQRIGHVAVLDTAAIQSDRRVVKKVDHG
jgi:hypothetical protein